MAGVSERDNSDGSQKRAFYFWFLYSVKSLYLNYSSIPRSPGDHQLLVCLDRPDLNAAVRRADDALIAGQVHVYCSL
jgi:hypothetical protein